MSPRTPRRGMLALVMTAALILAAMATASQASASTLYACVKKSGAAKISTKKPKCKKGEKKLSWSTTGPAGKNGANGSNGTNGTAGVAGQPQKAVSFSATSEAPFLSNKFTPLFELAGVTVKLNCTNVLVADVTALEASGPSGTHAVSGMTDSKSNNKEVTDGFQQDVYNVPITTTATAFAALTTDGGSPVSNVGHVNATITTPGAVILIDAFIEAGVSPENCVAIGSAFSIPT
jgi:hypothetical protein